MMVRRVLVLAAIVLAGRAGAARAQVFADTCGAKAPPRLEARGSQLVVDGQARFLVLASYFDAMRSTEAAVESDFAFLKRRGIDGIRIFPTWIHEVQQTTRQQPEPTLLDADGRIRSEERWNHLAMVLARAASCGFIVDLTMTRDMLNTVSPFSVEDYRGNPVKTTCRGGKGDRGMSELACRLRGAAYSHVIIDLQNERNAGNAGMHLTMDELRGLRDAVKTVDPRRLVMVSHGGGAVAESLAAARDAKMDVVAFHDDQREGWYANTAKYVEALKEAGLPIYVQEGARATSEGERPRGARCEHVPRSPAENPLRLALEESRRAGAAAWTFHTDAGFRLDSQTFQDELARCPLEMNFLDGLSR